MKKNIFIALLVVSTAFIGINNVSANVCEPIIDPYYDCYEEQDGTPNFQDPSLEDAKNCGDDYTTTVNPYCTKTCREEVTTKFPSTINPLSNDPNAPILSGSHFQWESSSIIVTRECEVNLNYSKIESTVNDLTEKYKKGVLTMIREILQWTNNKSCGESGFVVAGTSLPYTWIDVYDRYYALDALPSGWPIQNDMVYLSNGNCQKCGQDASKAYKIKNLYDESDECLKANQYCKEIKFESTQIPAPEISPVATKTGCPLLPGSTEVTDARYWTILDDDGNVTGCKYWELWHEATPGTGTWMSTTMMYNTIDNPTSWSKVNYTYCSDQPPFYDGSGNTATIGGAVSAWISNFNTIKEEYKKATSYIEQCYSAATSEIVHKPDVTVNYTDPTGNYADAKTPTKILLDRTTVNSSTDTKINSSVKSTINTYNCNSNLPTTQAAIAAYANNPDAAAPGNFCTENVLSTTLNSDGSINVSLKGSAGSSVVYTSIYSKTTEEYTYSMPGDDNGNGSVFRYVEKINGESSYKKPTPWDSEVAKKYIDIGYSNYPIHIDTLPGTYPIYLDYVNVGTGNRYNWSEFNKFEDGSTNTDLHRYYVCDYVVVTTTTTTECDPDDPYYPLCEEPPSDCSPTDPDYPDCRTNISKIPTCTPGTPFCPGDGTDGGIDVIYRPIDLDDPFPDESGDGREPGMNWSDFDVDRFITNNRDVDTENVYNKEPLYSFTLTPDSIQRINNYNKTTDYNDFNLDCYKETGKRCLSDFLSDIDKYVASSSGTCLGSSWSDFYTCADKAYPDAPNQDAVIGGINSEGNYECINCSDPANANHPGCTYKDF